MHIFHDLLWLVVQCRVFWIRIQYFYNFPDNVQISLYFFVRTIQIAEIIGYSNASKKLASLLCRAGLSWRTQDWKLLEPKTRIWVEIQMHSVLIHIIYLYVISYMGLKYARLDTSCLIMDFIWITHLCLECALYKHYVRVWNIYN